MSFGGGNVPGRPDMLASEADREAAQAELKQAFEDQRLSQDEFEARVGKAVAARTQGELAQLTQDIPRPAPAAPPRSRRIWLVAGGVAVLAVAGILAGVLSSSGSGPAQSSDAGAGPPANPNPGPPGPGDCPVGTSATALKIANALAGDPVYVDPGSSLLTPAQVSQLRTEIGQVDAGRIRIAAVEPATVTHGGGERALANAIASCQADGAGTTVLTTNESTYLVTSYNDDNAATSAVGAALNTHASLAAGLLDAVHRIATVDKASH
jgi:uncharacterized protein GlcG (DUF336 family)